MGCNGRISDDGVFKNCSLCRALEEKHLNIPEETLLPGTERTFPFVFVADDAFPLKDYIYVEALQSEWPYTRKKNI